MNGWTWSRPAQEKYFAILMDRASGGAVFDPGNQSILQSRSRNTERTCQAGVEVGSTPAAEVGLNPSVPPTMV